MYAEDKARGGISEKRGGISDKKGGIDELSGSVNKEFYGQPQDVNRANRAYDHVVVEPPIKVNNEYD